jgi:exoribonuclease-2
MSNFTKQNKIPVPYRVQESSNKLSKDNTQDSENKILYNFLLKKTMGKTYYSINPMQHSSLALTSYLHATSPIRRYADLLVHYQLNRYLNNKVLISKEDVQQIIKEINNQGRQNIMRFREDQKYWLSKWFENNTFNEYRVILLNWINRYKHICILYFIDYNFSSVSNVNSKLNINIGDNFNVKNTSHNTIDMNYFEIIS